MAVLGLRFCARAFSSCGKWRPLLIAVHGPLTIAAPPVAEHRLQTRRLSNCGSRAQSLRGMWDLPRPGLEPVSPALAGRLSTTAPPGKPRTGNFWLKDKFRNCDQQPWKSSMSEFLNKRWCQRRVNNVHCHFECQFSIFLLFLWWWTWLRRKSYTCGASTTPRHEHVPSDSSQLHKPALPLLYNRWGWGRENLSHFPRSHSEDMFKPGSKLRLWGELWLLCSFSCYCLPKSQAPLYETVQLT